MKKYVLFTVFSACLFLISCTADDLDSNAIIKQDDNLPVVSDDLNLPANESIPPTTKGKDD